MIAGTGIAMLFFLVYIMLHAVVVVTSQNISQYEGFWGSLGRALVSGEQQRYTANVVFNETFRSLEILAIVGIVGGASLFVYGIAAKSKNASEIKPIQESGVIYCTSCGRARPITAKYCPHCGQLTSDTTSTRKCPKCSSIVRSDAIFCGKCGGRL